MRGSTDVYWLEQTVADVPDDNEWLSASEAATLQGLHFAKRCADWRLGRWTAKRAVAVYLNLPGHSEALTEIEIRAAESGAPEVFLSAKPAPVCISLSHRAGIAVCAVAPYGAVLGCDLEVIEPHSEAFVADYFTAEEQALVAYAPAAARPRILALMWSGKESALKALRAGLRLDTRSVLVMPAEEGEECLKDAAVDLQVDSWHPLRVRYWNDHVFHGWWQETGSLLRTLVAAPPPVVPMLLHPA